MAVVDVSVLFGRRQEMRSSPGGFAADWAHGRDLLDAYGRHSALRLAPVYAAVTRITATISSLPCRAYTSAGRQVPSPPSLVADPGVKRINRVTWRTQLMMSLLLRGNAYGAVVSRNGMGVPQKIFLLDPTRVTVDETGAAPVYLYDGQRIPDEDVFHVPAFTPAGTVVGLSPIALFRAQIETGLYAVDFGRRWFRNGVAPSGKLRNSEKTVSPAEADTIKSRFKAAVSSGDLFVTGKDWDYQALTVSAADAQFLESIKATATTIATIYHLSPEDVGGETGSSMTYGTVELNGLRYAQQAILPWTTRIEAAIDPLLPQPQYVKFVLDGLARADLGSRMAAHAVALHNGIETLDEVRALEDRPPLTPEEVADWLAHYVPQLAPAPAPAAPAGGK